MTRQTIVTASRLHFGLLGWGDETRRRYGGLGLMIDRPGITIAAEPADSWSCAGPQAIAARAREVAERVAGSLAVEGGIPVGPLRLDIEEAPPEHVGLGTGTQLSLAVARLVADHAGRPGLDAAALAGLTGRGRRSGVGLHGFDRGGLIVDGGHRSEGGVPPLVARMDFPRHWHVLVVIPAGESGLHGPRESEAFRGLEPASAALSDRLCSLVLLGILPAVAEEDLDAFGAALTAIQFHVGRAFAPVQGGTFARPELEKTVETMRSTGLVGVGQSSWGPTLYGFSDADPHRRDEIRASIAERFLMPGGAVFWTTADHGGARRLP